jgi:hypothetical protein
MLRALSYPILGKKKRRRWLRGRGGERGGGAAEEAYVYVYVYRLIFYHV